MNFIETLAEKRQKWIEANRENDFEDGIKNLLTELYPDNAHFIYELLQNAEDAKATKVMFALDFDGLKFLHNGERQFIEKDIESITSIGKSTKKDDWNQIGKFGVGFKAVFSYTNSPKIYSGKYAFEIRDLVYPQQIKQILEPDNRATVFHFPFNHSQKSKEDAFQEIKKTLLALPDNTILFLQNIKEINWQISQEDKQDGFIRRSPLKEENFFEIEKKTENSQKSYWLRFTKETPGKKDLYVSLAFRLEKVNESEEFRIENKINKGDVSIFFPAEKEDSGLKFFIHAPFASTVARDSIQNRAENEELRDLIIELLIESLVQIKDYGILDRDFLSVMPNDEDPLSEFYKPFRTKIIETFQNQSFTPTWKDSFAPSEKLLQANKEIKSVINNESILKEIVANEESNSDYDWATNAQKGSRAYKFLESLKIREVNLGEILDKVADKFTKKEVANKILSSLSDEWLQSFYALLLKGKEEFGDHFKARQYSWEKPLMRIRDCFLIRLQNGTHVQSNDVFFQTEFITKVENLNLVKPEVYESGQNLNQREKAKLFLETIGVIEFQEKNEIERILKRHYTKERFNVTEEKNLVHIDMFVDFLNRNQAQWFLFKNYYFLRIENENAKYANPSQIFIDEPYEKTKLSIFAEFHNKYSLWNGYESKISDKEKFLSFLKAVGVLAKYEIIIQQVRTWANPLRKELLKGFNNTRETDSKADIDYQITDLPKYLGANHYEISKMIWKIVAKANKSVLTALYRPNRTYSCNTVPSQLVQTLKDYAWIPDKNNVFRKPSEIGKDELSDDFPYNNDNGWLDAIEFDTAFQKQIELNKKEIERKQNLALQLGFKSLEEVEEYKKHKEEFKSFLENRRIKKRKIPIPPSENNWNLKNFSFDDFGNKNTGFDDRNRTIVQKERSVVEEYQHTKIDSRDFLKSQYTNEWQQLVCQICQEEMPFQTYNGEYYFEAVKIVEQTTSDNISNYLCCCPNCAAMYRFANNYKEDMKSLILEVESNENENVLLTLELAHCDCEINFTEKHFAELVNFVERQNY